MLVGNTAQFRLYDTYVIQNYHQTIENMILRAAQALYPYVAKQDQIVVLAGKGNNGADGLALACLLKKTQKNVTVFLMHEKSKLSSGAIFYLEKALALAVPIYYLDEMKPSFSQQMFEETLSKAGVIVDAIFGTGLKGAPNDIEKMVIAYVNTLKDIPILAVDVPSGLNADNGIIYKEAVKAHLTVTFVAMKLGFLNPEAKAYTGEVHVEDLEYPQQLLKTVGFTKILDPHDIEKILKKRRYDGYKGVYGKLACITGSSKYPGASVISCGAALKTGAGIVSVFSSASQNVLLKYPEVIIENDLLNAIQHSTAILFGCGKGQDLTTAQQLEKVLLHAKTPVLLDADGINLIAERLHLLHQANCPIIMTPHIGEMQRLLQHDKKQDSVMGAIAFAKQYRVIIVLKGPHTMITDGNVAIRVPSGDRAMATAGMGDALAGMIASFLAQGYNYFEATILGTYLHGLAGEILGQKRYSVFASDIIDIIPELMMSVLKKRK